MRHEALPGAYAVSAPRLENGERGEAFRLLRLDVHRGYGCVGRSCAAPGDGGVYEIGSTFEDRFDVSVREVANPSCDTEALCLVLSRAAEPDSLDAS